MSTRLARGTVCTFHQKALTIISSPLAFVETIWVETDACSLKWFCHLRIPFTGHHWTKQLGGTTTTFNHAETPTAAVACLPALAVTAMTSWFDISCMLQRHQVMIVQRVLKHQLLPMPRLYRLGRTASNCQRDAHHPIGMAPVLAITVCGSLQKRAENRISETFADYSGTIQKSSTKIYKKSCAAGNPVIRGCVVRPRESR